MTIKELEEIFNKNPIVPVFVLIGSTNFPNCVAETTIKRIDAFYVITGVGRYYYSELYLDEESAWSAARKNIRKEIKAKFDTITRSYKEIKDLRASLAELAVPFDNLPVGSKFEFPNPPTMLIDSVLEKTSVDAVNGYPRANSIYVEGPHKGTYCHITSLDMYTHEPTLVVPI